MRQTRPKRLGFKGADCDALEFERKMIDLCIYLRLNLCH